MSWATDQALDLGRLREQQSHEREWQLHCAQIIKRDGHIFFKSLADQIEIYVKEFLLASGLDGLTIERKENPLSVSVTKEPYPAIHVSP
jgi:hypothetical protein